MVFRDQMLVCQECGKTFFYTVTEQRRQADRLGVDELEAPELCPSCSNRQSSPPPSRSEPVAQVENVEVRKSERPEPREQPVQRAPLAQPVQPAPAREESEQAPSIQVKDFPLEEAGVEVKLIGAVKWFNRNKGYGFVTMADGQDVFFHRSDVVGAPLSQIKDGIRVEFQVRETKKGLEAFNVSPLPSS